MRVVNQPKNPRVFFAICALACVMMLGAAASAWAWAETSHAARPASER